MILENKEIIEFDPRNKTLRYLLRKEILEKGEKNHLHISVPLFRRWIKEKQLMM
jgi:hypothetical protein